MTAMVNPVVLVPMAYVASVPRSIAFYQKLGFEVGNTHAPPGSSEPVWAWLRSAGAQLMVAKAGDPVNPKQQAVLFYLYSADVAAYRNRLLESGVEAGPIQTPFWSPRGEFRVTDPDGYVLMIAHT
jgi:catechol 2,3-dioxygenase-like lactoylglutathione lyase family enzyme